MKYFLPFLFISQAAAYTIVGKFGEHCWGGQNNVNVEYDINITPMPTAETGLPNVQIKFNKPVSITTKWNVDNSQTNGNTWSFDLLDDQPVVGGILKFTGIDCNNGQPSEQLTADITVGGQQTPSVTPVTMAPCPVTN
jgi:hypothetical protein